MTYEAPPHVSPSQITKFLRCGERYRLDYIEGRRTREDTLPTVVGDIVHGAIEEDERAGEHGVPEKLLDVFRQRLRNYPGVEDLQYWGSKDLRWWINNPAGLPRIYDNYRAVCRREQENGWHPVEWEYEATYLTGHCQKFLGYIDRIVFNADLGVYRVQDWKTGKRKPEHDWQVEFYRLAIAADFNVQCGQVIYLADKQCRTETVPPTFSKDVADRLIEAPRRGVYVANGPHTAECDYCPYVAECEVGQLGQTNVLLDGGAR